MNDQKAHVEIKFASHTYTATVREPSKLLDFLSQQSESYQIISVDYIDAGIIFIEEIKKIVDPHWSDETKPVTKPSLKKYLQSHTRDLFAEAKRAAIKEHKLADREFRRENPSLPKRGWRAVYETGNITYSAVAINSQADLSHFRDYVETFPTRKNIESMIQDVLDHIRQDVVAGKDPYGFKIIVDAAVLSYPSHADKFRGYDAEPTGEYTEPVLLASLLKEDVEIQLGL